MSTSYNLGKVVGEDGVGLNYDWDGTSLGVKREDESEYTYVDLKGEKGDAGQTGASGSDGYSPTVSTSKEGKTTTIEITDKNGTHTATIQDGADGSNGVDGISPTATVSKSGNTATITITDKNGTTTTSVSDGTNGTNGRDGYVQYTAGTGIDITNNVISASGGEQDTEVYMLTTDFTSGTISLSNDDITTLNKAIDSFREGKKVVLMARQIMFYMDSGYNVEYSYNVLGRIRESGNTITITFYRNYAHNTSKPISFAINSLQRIITLSNVGTPSNVISASLSSAQIPSYQTDIYSVFNTSTFTPNAPYNLVHKKYVDDSVATKQDIIQYSTMPTASASNEGQIVQYIGATTNDYTNGYFYKCVSDEEETPTYSWENIEVQGGASSDEDTFYFDGSSNPNTEEKKALWQKIYDRWHIEGKGSNLYIFVGNNRWVLCDLTFAGNYSISYTPVPSNTNTQYFYAMTVSGSVSFTNGVVSNINPYFLANYKRVKIPQEYNTSAPEYNSFYVLGTNNTKAYTPTADYHPSTKKYVDDSISNAIGSINTILATLTTPSNNGGGE